MGQRAVVANLHRQRLSPRRVLLGWVFCSAALKHALATRPDTRRDRWEHRLGKHARAAQGPSSPVVARDGCSRRRPRAAVCAPPDLSLHHLGLNTHLQGVAAAGTLH
eukprot:3207733-Pleurochrysis_carterae.AAC.1